MRKEFERNMIEIIHGYHMLSFVYIHYSIVQLVITPTGASIPSKWRNVTNIRRTWVMMMVLLLCQRWRLGLLSIPKSTE